MTEHYREVYKLAAEYLEGKIQVDHNILEYACMYHDCCSKLDANEKYKILIGLFSEERVKVIMQLILVMNKPPGGNNVVWKPYSAYLDALRYAESKAASNLVG